MSDIQLLIIGTTLVFGIAISFALIIWNFQTLADEIF